MVLYKTMTIFLQTLRTVFLDVIADFFYFPIWWYTRGLGKQMQGSVGSLRARKDALALDIWMKNILTPMYGQYDIVGRLISFFMRLAQIIGRTVALFVWGLLLVIWLLIWLLIPLGMVYLIYSQIMNFV